MTIDVQAEKQQLLEEIAGYYARLADGSAASYKQRSDKTARASSLVSALVKRRGAGDLVI
jgi:hypothetical protein